MESFPQIPNYTKVRYEEVYPGIDLVYYGNQGNLEYDFIVKPGADPNSIRMAYRGVDGLSVESGDLVMHMGNEKVIQKAPLIYQEIDGKRIKVAGNYIFTDENQVAFYLDKYDQSQPLIIDPVLAFSTFLGGDGYDAGRDIAVDESGDLYVAGWTGPASIPFPTTTGAYETTHSLSGMVFISKLTADGSTLLYSTFLGGSSSASLQGIAVDDSGNVFVTGDTGGGTIPFPTTPGAFDTTHNGAPDAFISKLSADGSTLLYSTFLGGSGFEYVRDILVDDSGNAIVSGGTGEGSIPFPTTPGAFSTIHNGEFDAFVSKLSADGSTLLYSTLLGGSDRDRAHAIAVDGAGNVLVTGYTNFSSYYPPTTPFPTTPGAFDTTYNGALDAFVSKLSADGSTLLYSTFLGGSSSDQAWGIAVDGDDNAYVAGTAFRGYPISFPTTPGAFDTNNFNKEAFVSKLSADGSTLLYSTFLGGVSALAIAVDRRGNAVVTGEPSLDFPTTPGAFDTTHNGASNVFVSRLNADGSSLLYSTFLGGNGGEEVSAIALDGSGNPIVI